MALSTVDRNYNLAIIEGERGIYGFEPFFEDFIKAEIDEDGHIVAPCTGCNVPVRFDVDYDGDVDCEGRQVVYQSFNAVDGSKIKVNVDVVLCAACRAEEAAEMRRGFARLNEVAPCR